MCGEVGLGKINVWCGYPARYKEAIKEPLESRLRWNTLTPSQDGRPLLVPYGI